MIKVFISHSTNSDPFAAEVRTLVAEGLRKKHYDVLVDADGLHAGMEWRAELYHWLRECHAALVLVNRAALESDWVSREVNILMWRRSHNRALRVVPAFVGPVSSSDLRGSALGELATLQVARTPRRPAGPREPTAAELADTIVAAFPDVHPLVSDDVVRAWVEDIAAQLKRLWDLSRLERVVSALELPAAELDGLAHDSSGCEFVASQMIGTHRADRVDAAIEVVHRHMDSTPLSNLVELVLPVWVDAASARHVVPAEDAAESCAIVLNVHDPETGTHYLHRAFCMNRTRYAYRHVSVGALGEEEAEAALRAQCLAQLRDWLGLRRDQPLRDAVPPRPDRHHYLVVDAHDCTLDEAWRVVRWLHDELDWLHILLIPPYPVDRADCADGRGGLRVLQPPFGADDEQLAIRTAREWRTAYPRVRR
ncbi:toll/interleukin-1 receptor domain-containing protein [Streptomyces sp. NPDC051940]|uniref:toll/interleukin-1 receptor domain-containing protein n=1 Tax=Streptomyces sp. NPDC051940 TaxID=3155675 RepID=UPI00342DB7B2